MLFALFMCIPLELLTKLDTPRRNRPKKKMQYLMFVKFVVVEDTCNGSTARCVASPLPVASTAASVERCALKLFTRLLANILSTLSGVSRLTLRRRFPSSGPQLQQGPPLKARHLEAQPADFPQALPLSAAFLLVWY